MYEASNLDFLLTWFSHCYSRFLLLTFPCYIFAHSFTINFTFTVLQVCLLSKAYSKLIIHHCFLQPSFTLKIFVLTSLSFGRSNSLNSFLRLHEYFFTCSFLKTVFQLGLGFGDYIPFSQKFVNIFHCLIAPPVLQKKYPIYFLDLVCNTFFQIGNFYEALSLLGSEISLEYVQMYDFFIIKCIYF